MKVKVKVIVEDKREIYKHGDVGTVTEKTFEICGDGGRKDKFLEREKVEEIEERERKRN